MKTERTKRDHKAWQQMQLERMIFQMQQAKPATTATATKKTKIGDQKTWEAKKAWEAKKEWEAKNPQQAKKRKNKKRFVRKQSSFGAGTAKNPRRTRGNNSQLYKLASWTIDRDSLR